MKEFVNELLPKAEKDEILIIYKSKWEKEEECNLKKGKNVISYPSRATHISKDYFKENYEKIKEFLL